MSILGDMMGILGDMMDGAADLFFNRSKPRYWQESGTRSFSSPGPDGMVKVPAGTFKMGANDIGYDEMPVHEVVITKDFYLDETEVTEEAYLEVTGRRSEPVKLRSLYIFALEAPVNRPVTNVSWDDADGYCRAIGKRLPTEAEWEKAASVGGRYLFGTKSGTREKLADEACFDKQDGPCSVKEYPPNALGLYGMSGNVWEWVSDRRGRYPSDRVVDPKGPNDGGERVLRGGAWTPFHGADHLRASSRGLITPLNGLGNIGFRCARF